VADASADLANETILRLADQKVSNERLVGVFAKCDRAEHQGKIVEIVKTRQLTTGKALQHGWYVIRNLGPHDDSLLFDRDEAEKSLFCKEPWCQISQDRRGTANLKKFLSTLLCQRIRDGFPEMQKSVERLLTAEYVRLLELGKPRETLALQRAYLVEITQRFQNLAKKALNKPEDLPSDGMRLRGLVQRSKSSFAKRMHHDGHLYEFFEIDNPDQATSPPRSQRTLYDEIRTQILVNQGEELQGMINPAVLKPLLQKQASKWPDFARDHLEQLAEQTEKCTLNILEAVCKDLCGGANYTYEDLKKIVLDFSKPARKQAMMEVDRLWVEEATLHLQTNNPSFIQNVKAAQLLRFEAALARYNKSNPSVAFMLSLVGNNPKNLENIPSTYKSWTIISPDTIQALLKQMHSRGERNTEDEIHDLLKAYYEVIISVIFYYKPPSTNLYASTNIHPRSPAKTSSPTSTNTSPSPSCKTLKGPS
jgi:hypothetical protein